MTTLVIVESPNKVRKIQAALGAGYDVMATLGHFRDLPPSALGIDLETMEPTYVAIRGKADVARRLRARAKKASEVILAADPDREGEGIAWHAATLLGAKGRRARRARFHEITPAAIQAAVRNAGELDLDLVGAQQARRVLDRLCGYQVSPLLWPFGRRLSAGRVQSATFHLVVERERARRSFEVRTYWQVRVGYNNGLVALLAGEDDKGQLQPLQLGSRAEAAAIAAELPRLAHQVASVDASTKLEPPRPPFTTSSMQQVASSVLKFGPDETMAVAQQLFEAGLITYHRTDSVHLSDEAIRLAREHMARMAPDLLPEKPPQYRSRSRSQEAHEAIRPTTFELDSHDLDERAVRLWDLIRDRFLACQSKPAVLRQVEVAITTGEHRLCSRWSDIVQPGYRRFLAFDETSKPRSEDGELCGASVTEGQVLAADDAAVTEGQSRPPPRFTDATLIREMEKVGIGRPSTYAATVKVLLTRGYATHERRNLVPTDLGEMVDRLLGQGFPDLVKPELTAMLEEQLDQVARGECRWKPLCQAFQAGLVAQIERARPLFNTIFEERKTMSNETADTNAQTDNKPKSTGKMCPECGKELQLRHGKRGPFLGCSGYPQCRYTVDPNVPQKDGSEAKTIPCPICKEPMRLRSGSRGEFWSCAECRKTVDAQGLARAKGAKCRACGSPMSVRTGKKGEFLGCTRYPDCRETAQLPDPKAKNAVAESAAAEAA